MVIIGQDWRIQVSNMSGGVLTTWTILYFHCVVIWIKSDTVRPQLEIKWDICISDGNFYQLYHSTGPQIEA